MAIRENYAASHVLPGSEAAAVRQREEMQYRSTTTRTGVSTPHKVDQVSQPLPKSALELVAEAFNKLPMADRYEYELHAQKALEAAPPSWLFPTLQSSGFNHPVIRAAIRTKAIELWQTHC